VIVWGRGRARRSSAHERARVRREQGEEEAEEVVGGLDEEARSRTPYSEGGEGGRERMAARAIMAERGGVGLRERNGRAGQGGVRGV
jgi:hypothetical protein